jgi:hypothetical protein
MFAWWGCSHGSHLIIASVEQGGRGFGVIRPSLLVVLNLFGMFPGYASFGGLNHLGRRALHSLRSRALLVPLHIWRVLRLSCWYWAQSSHSSGPDFSSRKALDPRVRARALGFTYNGARTMSSLAPLTIGWVGQIKGLSWAFYLCAAAFFLASVMATQLPETKGKQLD